MPLPPCTLPQVAQVCDWLELIGLGQYRRRFVHNAVSGAVLLKLSNEELKVRRRCRQRRARSCLEGGRGRRGCARAGGHEEFGPGLQWQLAHSAPLAGREDLLGGAARPFKQPPRWPDCLACLVHPLR